MDQLHLNRNGLIRVHPEILTLIFGGQRSDIGGHTAIASPVQVGALKG